MKYLFIGGYRDGEWIEVPTGCCSARIEVPQMASVDYRPPPKVQIYNMQGWSADGKVIHRVFVYDLTPDQTFIRMMLCYKADKQGAI